MRDHPPAGYSGFNLIEGDDWMDKLLTLALAWLNPINLGVFLLCLAAALWILSRTDPRPKQ